ncbi:MAG: DUF1289 domain-containing protein, partial [Gammaproteobacteria bacterium]
MSELQQTPDVPSPCIDACTLNECEVCIGCGRSIEEITGWSSASNAERLAIVERSKARRKSNRP